MGTTSWVGRNKAFRAQARISVSGKLPETPPRATLGWSYSGLLGWVLNVGIGCKREMVAGNYTLFVLTITKSTKFLPLNEKNRRLN